jgi:hypothetical protein
MSQQETDNSKKAKVYMNDEKELFLNEDELFIKRLREQRKTRFCKS